MKIFGLRVACSFLSLTYSTASDLLAPRTCASQTFWNTGKLNIQYSTAFRSLRPVVAEWLLIEPRLTRQLGLATNFEISQAGTTLMECLLQRQRLWEC